MQETAEAAKTGETIPAAVEFPLRRPRFWSPGFAVLFAVLAVGAVSYHVSALPRIASLGGGFMSLLPHLLVPLSFCAVGLLYRVLARPRAVPPVTFFDQYLTLPRSAESRRAMKIPYHEILSVDLSGRVPRERLLIGTRRRLFILPRLAFVSPDAVEQATKELYVRILRLPQGSQVVDGIAHRRKLAIATMGNSAAATYLILMAAGLLFSIEFLLGALDSPLGHIRFGANAPSFVKQGDAYRLLSSTLMHASAVHFYFDALVLYFFGSLLERLLGRARFLLIFITSGLACALATTLWGGGLFSVNGSGPVFGLLGAIAVILQRFRFELPAGLAQPLRWWPVMMALVGSLVFAVPEIDGVGNIAAVLAGALVAFLVVDGNERLDPQASARPALRYTAAVLASLFALSGATAVTEAFRANGRNEERMARTLANEANLGAPALNELAWRFACYAAATPDALAIAEEAARRAVQLAPENMSILDTLAAVKYRQGHLDEAVALERQVFETTGDGSAAEHLAKFLAARVAKEGPLLLGGARLGAVQIRLGQPASAGAPAPAEIGLKRAAEFPKGLALYALARRGDNVVGLLRVDMGAGGEASTFTPTAGPSPWPRATEYAVALLDPACLKCSSGQRDAAVWNLEVRLYDDLP